MTRLNLLILNFGASTHEGAPARNISPELQLRRLGAGVRAHSPSKFSKNQGILVGPVPGGIRVHKRLLLSPATYASSVAGLKPRDCAGVNNSVG